MIFKKIAASLLALGIFILPLASLAQTTNPGQGSIIPCGRVQKDSEGKVKTDPLTGRPEGECQFSDIFVFINNLIRFMLFRLAVPLAALSIMYAGFLMVTAAGNMSQVSKAKTIFQDTAIGFVIAIAAFAVVRFILSVVDPRYNLLNKVN